MLKNTLTSYGFLAKFFHWIIFFLVASTIPLGYFMDDVADKITRGEVVNIHKLIGLLILTLMVLRAAWALMNPKPALPLNTPKWGYVAERTMHFSLYFVLILMPLCGFLGSVAAGHAPHLFGWNFNLPIQQNKSFADLCFTIHNTVAVIIIVLVSLHILAAIYHHVIKKDNILLRMIP